MQQSDEFLHTQPLYPFRFIPIYKDYLWGGERLRTRFGRPLPKERIAESWDIVDRPGDESVILNGALRGRTLNELVRNRRKDLLGAKAVDSCRYERFPLILKYLDARLPLSVQVHPDDEVATATNLADGGKTEAWLVVDAVPDSKLWVGTNRNYSKKELENAIRIGKLEHCLHSVPAKVGDCFFLPAGTLHALGAGIMVVEVQTNSDITFRLFDWNRVGSDGKPRDLKVPEALCAMVDPCGPISIQTPFSTEHENCERLVIDSRFTLNRWQVREPFVWHNDDRAHLWTVLEGTAVIIFNAGRRTSPTSRSERERDPDAIEVLHMGDSLLVPAMCPSLRWTSEGKKRTVLLDVGVT